MLIKDSSGKARRRIAKRLDTFAAETKRIWKSFVANPSHLPQPARVWQWQNQAEVYAKKAKHRNKAYRKIADALTGDDANHRELRMADLTLQAFFI